MSKRYTSKAYKDLPYKIKNNTPELQLDLLELDDTPHNCNTDEICFQCTTIKLLVMYYRDIKTLGIKASFDKEIINKQFDENTNILEIIEGISKRLKYIEKKLCEK